MERNELSRPSDVLPAQAQATSNTQGDFPGYADDGLGEESEARRKVGISVQGLFCAPLDSFAHLLDPCTGRGLPHVHTSQATGS